MQCPLCQSDTFKDISECYHRCRNCGIIFNSKHTAFSYNNNYFIDDYESQYGKTYEEDFTHIYNLSISRLIKIENLIKKNPSGLSLLDTGSALGFFLKAALDRGYKELSGIEISSFGASYCRNNFNISVIEASLDDLSIESMYDIITAWFVVEHLARPLRFLNECYDHLHEGGLLALSLPSFYGPLFDFHREEWITSHPQDHFIDVSPFTISKTLKAMGFKEISVYSAGFHPDRIISSKSVLYRPFTWLYRLFVKITAYSDTIEVYAKK